MNIVTVRWGNKFSEDYVTALKAQVKQLKVLTDEDGSLLEPRRYFGWWSKLEVFRPENRHLRPCLFIDLDTFVMGSLAPFFRLDNTKLWLIRDFYHLKKRSNSGLFIAPKHGISDAIWNQAQGMHFTSGDGDYLTGFPHEKLQDHVSGILSYKVNNLADTFPKKARIVCFHGKTKPSNVEGWAIDYWMSCLKM